MLNKFSGVLKYVFLFICNIILLQGKIYLYLYMLEVCAFSQIDIESLGFKQDNEYHLRPHYANGIFWDDEYEISSNCEYKGAGT